MKARIIITNEQEAIYEGEVELSRASSPRQKTRKKSWAQNTASISLDFDMPIRAFIKKNSHDMSGDKKFTLLLSYLTKGEEREQIELSEIENHWNKMTTLLGGKFNRAYTIRANDNGWVDAPKQGVYVLAHLWKEALKLSNG